MYDLDPKPKLLVITKCYITKRKHLLLNPLSHSLLGHVVDREAELEVEADLEAEPGPVLLTKRNVDLLDSQ